MLELEGLVIMIPRKGAQVAQITEKDLNDVLEVRLGLEELAARFACERIRSEALGICTRRRGNLSLFWKLTICRLWQRQMWISTILFIRPRTMRGWCSF